MKRRLLALSLILMIVLVGCVPSKYIRGVDTNDYLDDIIPIEKSMTAFELDISRDEDEYELKAGTKKDVDEMIEFYQEFFEEEEIGPSEEEERRGYVATGFYEGYRFTLEISEPSESPEDTLFNTVVHITLEYGANTQLGEVGDYLGAQIIVNADEDDVNIESTGYISNEGGTLSINQGEQEGASVTIPAAAIDRSINVSVGTVEANIDNAPESLNQTLLYVDVEDYGGFTKPMEITMKYADNSEEAEKVPVPVYIDENGQFQQMTLKSINKEAGTFTFYTYHASYYTYYKLDDLSTYTNAENTGFKPSVDGFKERNQGSSKHRGGECYGMSSFAKWYFLNIKGFEDDKGLYKRFTDVTVGISSSDPDDTITHQDFIATMTFQYTNDQSKVLALTENQHSHLLKKNAEGEVEYFIDNEVAAKSIIDSLYWGWPAEVGIYGPANKPGGHSVLAYAYKKQDNGRYRIFIYDPNYPGDDNQYIDYDPTTKDIHLSGYADGTLDGYLTTTGTGTFTFVDKYQQIYEDALDGFEGTITDLEITSHEFGEEVEEPTIYLEGTLDTLDEFGEQIGEYIDIINEDGDIFTYELTANGVNPRTFIGEIPLKNGENWFYFTTYYKDQNSNENQITTDMMGWFLINSTIPSNVIYVTLTWDYQPDVDLYVTNPAGETSWYSSYYTSAGGFLDIDDRYSYGPEHYTLTTENTVYYDEGYDINVHYYEGEGPTSYSVTVVVNEGTEYEYTEYFTGVIGESNMYNDSPGSGGLDWAYITTVYPVDTRDEEEE
jgi:hypothetical protein